MSSHHIVRDNQEPALVVLSGDLNIQTLYALLEWSPVVIAYEEADMILADLGIKTDYFIYRQEETLNRLKEHQSHVSFLQEQSDMIVQITELLTARSCKGASFIGGSLSDQQWLKLSEAGHLRFSLYTENARVFMVTENTYRKWLPAGLSIDIRPLTPQESYNITGRHTVTDSGITTAADGLISVSSAGILLVSEPV